MIEKRKQDKVNSPGKRPWWQKNSHKELIMMNLEVDLDPVIQLDYKQALICIF